MAKGRSEFETEVKDYRIRATTLVPNQTTGCSLIVEEGVGFFLICNDAPIQSFALLIERTLLPPDKHHHRRHHNSHTDRDQEPDAVSREERLPVSRRTHSQTIAVRTPRLPPHEVESAGAAENDRVRNLSDKERSGTGAP